jgi:hypothetical protein
MLKTGLNSIANSDSWAFLQHTTYNQHRRDLWQQRNIQTIRLRVDEHPDANKFSRWDECVVEWNQGETHCTVTFLPYAKTWYSTNSWIEHGYKRWWNLCDELILGLQLYQLPGKCFYKSDFLEDFEDVDPNGTFSWSTAKFKRWFQFRHWCIFWYGDRVSGWNWQWTETPPKSKTGEDFKLSDVLSLPSMPDLTMPSITLPSLPDVSLPSLPNAPSLPDMPNISAPNISAPNLSAPNLSAPNLSMPEKKSRSQYRWEAHGLIELKDLHVRADGRKVILSNATVHHFWQTGGRHETEKKEHQRFELLATTPEQAESWKLTLMASGVKEGDIGGCCCAVS